jgi:predicted site-specific integrase-resolvase
MALLRCNARTLAKMAKDGKLKRTKLPSGRTDWDDHEVYSVVGLNPKDQVNVVYCRTEPTDSRSSTTESRLAEQKDRVLKFCEKRGIQVDVVIEEVRKVNRVRNSQGDPAAGWAALLGLLAERRVKTLILESRDRLNVGSSWEMMEWFFQQVLGTEIFVINQTVLTTESREEAKYWVADALQVYKVSVGEIRDKHLIAQFVGGPDAGMARTAVKRLDQKLREKRAEARLANPKVPKPKKEPIDLDDLFG